MEGTTNKKRKQATFPTPSTETKGAFCFFAARGGRLVLASPTLTATRTSHRDRPRPRENVESRFLACFSFPLTHTHLVLHPQQIETH